MPRKSKRSSLATEDNVAEHVRIERERRGWSTGELADRVTAAGCPINQSAIWRIESGNPRRKISVNELIAFAAVFGYEPEALLLPAGGENEEASMIYEEITAWLDTASEYAQAKRDYDYYLGVLVTDVWGHEELQEKVPELLKRAIAAHEAGFSPEAYNGLYSNFVARLKEAEEKGRPPYGPSALEILQASREKGKDMEWARARAAHWGCSEDLETILESGKVWVPGILGNKLQEMTLDEFLNASMEEAEDVEPPVSPRHPARWTSDKFIGEVEP